MSTGNGTVFRIEKTKDFTTMSNHHLKNMSLSLKAKGLLSMILSLPENWDYSISGLASICKEGENALRNTIKELEEAGYIRRFQERDKAGKMGRVNFIVSEIPTLKNGVGSTSSPLDANPQADNPHADNPLADNSRQLNTKELNTKQSNTNQSFFPEESEEKTFTGLERLEQTERMIKTQIEYEILEDRYKDERINELLEIILEVYLHEDEYFYIGKEKRLTALVKRRFYKLDFESIASVLDGLNDNITQISDMKAYLLMCLYNAPAVVNNKVHAQVNHDFYFDF